MENILTALIQLAAKVIPSGGEALLYGSQARGTAPDALSFQESARQFVDRITQLVEE